LDFPVHIGNLKEEIRDRLLELYRPFLEVQT